MHLVSTISALAPGGPGPCALVHLCDEHRQQPGAQMDLTVSGTLQSGACRLLTVLGFVEQFFLFGSPDPG